MPTSIYVGNLAFATTSNDLRTLFAEYGEVSDAKVINDRDTGRSRGFGFVEMSSKEAAQAAISALDGRDVSGRALKVNLAQPRSR
jgi:RNA recognition motif-containing protein